MQRERLYEIIFEADTKLGKVFDVVLLILIMASVMAVILESVPEVASRYGPVLRVLEWTFTITFTVEYGLRLFCVNNPWRYARSFFGLVDLLAILPSYVSLIIPGAHTLLVVRIIRLLRVFRVFKLVRYLGEANTLVSALRASRPKITVFLLAIASSVVVVGSAMFLIEGAEHGFDSIPAGMYWAIVTMTTVGYGDMVPMTDLGRLLASVLMVMGYAIIAVPTGIVSAELIQHARKEPTTQCCPECLSHGHDKDAVHCKYCGSAL